MTAATSTDNAATRTAGPTRARAAVAIAAVLVLVLWPIEIERAFGLPAHPLLLHVPVVFVPVLGLATIVAALRPRHTLAVAVFSVVTLAFTLLTVGAGQAFLESLPREEASDPRLKDHQGAGETVRSTLVLLTFTLAGMLFAKRKPKVLLGLRILAVLLALTAVGFTIRAGHLGSEIVWGG